MVSQLRGCVALRAHDLYRSLLMCTVGSTGMAKRRRDELTVLHRATGWWVTLRNDNARYVAGPFGSETEARTYVETLGR